MKGAVPPATVAVAVPLAEPPQEVVLVKLSVNTFGSAVTDIDALVAVQELESTTVTVNVPVVVAVMLLVVSPVLQR